MAPLNGDRIYERCRLGYLGGRGGSLDGGSNRRRSSEMMSVEFRVSEEPVERLDEHVRVHIRFRVERILSVSTLVPGLGDIWLSEAAVERPWVKDYDAIKGEGPTRWPKRFDTSNWGLIAAHDGTKRVGGAAIVFNTAGRRLFSEVADFRLSPGKDGSGQPGRYDPVSPSVRNIRRHLPLTSPDNPVRLPQRLDRQSKESMTSIRDTSPSRTRSTAPSRTKKSIHGEVVEYLSASTSSSSLSSSK
jgi:hypothetical protein